MQALLGGIRAHLSADSKHWDQEEIQQVVTNEVRWKTRPQQKRWKNDGVALALQVI